MGLIASGALTGMYHSSGAISSGQIASGAVLGQAAAGAFVIASGSIAGNDLSSGAVNSGHLASGNIINFARINIDDTRLAGQAISGVIAVTFGSGGQYIVPAERQSGLRLPAIGVSTTNALSGAAVSFVTRGFVSAAASGTIASGNQGQLYVGSGGLIVNLSGFMGGNSSGPGPNQTVTGGMSGQLVQRIGIAVSGGIYVMPDVQPTSGLVSGLLGQY